MNSPLKRNDRSTVEAQESARQQGLKEYAAFIELFSPGRSQNKDSSSPLYGYSFAVKDNIPIKNSPLSLGVSPPVLASSAKSADIVSMLQKLGAECVGRSNLDVLALDFTGYNPYYGSITNPIVPEITPAGSSGGSAAAVALGAADFALGTDFGGSVRAPAAVMGIWGLKLSAGNFVDSSVPLWSPELDSLGIFAKDLETLRYIYTCLDPSIKNDEIKGIAIPHAEELDCVDTPAHEDFLAHVEKLRTKYDIHELSKDFFLNSIRARKVLAIRASADKLKNLNIPPELIPDQARAIIAAQETLKDSELRDAELTRKHEAEELAALDYYILSPTLPSCTLRANEVRNSSIARDKGMHRFLTLANLLSLPALACPISSGFSLQIVGKPGLDSALLSSAAALTER